MMLSGRWQKLAFLFLIGTTSVFPTLWGDFVFDDGEAIVKNSDVSAPGWENVYNVFVHDFWGVDITHRLSHKSFRPLTTLSYRLDYYIWGHNPFPFHLFDLIIHGLNCVLVYLFLSKCVKQKSELNSSKAENLAFWGTILFCVHPVHVEPLGAIVGRADLLGSMIFLGAFCLVNDHHSYKGVILLSIFSIIGSLFKETAITLSVFVLLLELWNLWSVNSEVSKRPNLLRSLITIIIAASFVGWRLWLQGGPPVFQPFDNPPAFAPTSFSRGSLFRSALQVCPNNAKVHYNLGTMYGDLSERMSAEKSYKTAISLRADYYQAMNNLGNLLRVNSELEEAETWLRKAVEIKPDFAAAWMNLGIILSTSNKSEALSCYINALKFRKAYPDCEYNLGNLYLDMGDKEMALKAWQRATSLKSTHSQAWINTVILLEQEGKLKEARETAVKALQVLKFDDTLHFILGNILGKLSEFESAKASFEQAIKICSKLKKRIPPKYYSNLGVLYHRWGKKDHAIDLYQKALTIDPRLTSAKKNLAMLLKI
ncbi:unnamed protein product [Orchesella dallaii]|uniref:Dolichyl-phosphate-mannose--protein mannosyltransferase n=1 Tax=Orchesella dallaii TaxID=48710 RepID=A0ABP1S5R6_9HEXA